MRRRHIVIAPTEDGLVALGLPHGEVVVLNRSRWDDSAGAYEMSCGSLMNVDDGIQALVERGFWFQGVHDDGGAVTVVIGSYGWPDCYDRLHIWAEHEAIAARCVPSGRRGSDDVVWTYQDGALTTIQALLDLPHPDDSAAPKLAKRAPSGLWLPSSGARV